MSIKRVDIEEKDRALLLRFARHGDNDAFSIIMTRHADVVYSTCRRILADEALAADAMQETFFHLIKNPERITGSLSSWLHQVAVRRAVDLIRQNVSRRHRESTYALDAGCPSNTWAEVEPLVDEALELLPEDLRELLVLHYLERKSMTSIAAAKGLSQPTVSRRVADALDQLRQILRNRGVSVGLIPLQSVLLHSAMFAPQAALRGLGKMALAHAAAISPVGSASSAFVSLKYAVTAVALVIVWGGACLLGLHEHAVEQDQVLSQLAAPAPNHSRAASEAHTATPLSPTQAAKSTAPITTISDAEPRSREAARIVPRLNLLFTNPPPILPETNPPARSPESTLRLARSKPEETLFLQPEVAVPAVLPRALPARLSPTQPRAVAAPPAKLAPTVRSSAPLHDPIKPNVVSPNFTRQIQPALSVTISLPPARPMPAREARSRNPKRSF